MTQSAPSEMAGALFECRAAPLANIDGALYAYRDLHFEPLPPLTEAGAVRVAVPDGSGHE